MDYRAIGCINFIVEQDGKGFALQPTLPYNRRLDYADFSNVAFRHIRCTVSSTMTIELEARVGSEPASTALQAAA